MVIKLTSADYSLKNIGKIEVNAEINEFTKSAITASGKSMSFEQKSALDTFFKSIGAFGTASQIWSKLENVFLPIVCEDIAHAKHNFKSGGTDLTLNAERYGMRSGGIAGLQETTSNYTANTFPIIPRKNDFSEFVMLTENSLTTNSKSQILISAQGKSGTNRYYDYMLTNSSGDEVLLRRSHISPSGSYVLGKIGIMSEDKKYKLIGLSLSGTSTAKFIALDGTLVSSTYVKYDDVGTDTESVNSNIFASSAGKPYTTADAPIGMFMLGHALTDDEMVVLRNAANTLVSYFI